MEALEKDIIIDKCRAFKLSGVRQNLDQYVVEAAAGNWSHSKFLAQLLLKEAEHREDNRIKALIKKACFRDLKYLEDLDKSLLPEQMRNALPELETLDFITEKRNVVMYGTPGTGKTHCASALALKACKAGMSVLYTSVPRLLIEIKESDSKRKLTRLMKKFEKYDLVVLDECGYRSMDKISAEYLFQMISIRSGTKSTIVTTNLGFDRWQEIFTDKIIAAALVDRLAFRSYIIDMNGPSYRLRVTENWLNSRKEKTTEAKS